MKTELAHELRTQDNACTAHPIYIVQRKRRVYGFDPNSGGPIAWVDVENESSEADPEEHARLEAGYRAFLEESEGWIRTSYQDTWDFVQPFLTRKAAEAYIAAQKHNLGEARVYVESAYGNPEWQFVRAHFSGLYSDWYPHAKHPEPGEYLVALKSGKMQTAKWERTEFEPAGEWLDPDTDEALEDYDGQVVTHWRSRPAGPGERG